MRSAIALDPDAAIAVEFELELPFRTVRQLGDGEAEHRFEETAFILRQIRQLHRIAQAGDQIFVKANDLEVTNR